MKKMMKVAAMVAAMVLTAGVAACQEKIPPYLIVDGTTITGCDKAALPANLVIPRGITKIAGGAFAGCESLESVTIPGSVKIIGEDITYEETGGKKWYELSIFPGCGSLRNVTIEKGVKTIGLGAFANCKSLASVTIPNSVTKIGGGAFAECESLANVTIPGSVRTIGEDITWKEAESKGMKLEMLSVFYGCGSLRNVTIEKGVKIIGFGAFADCESLASVSIPDSVTKIGLGAFANCKSLASVTIPGSVMIIGEDTTQEEAEEISEGLGVFSGCDLLRSVTIEKGVKTIGLGAFSDCESLASVTIPVSVTEIGESAFGNCLNLKIQYDGTKAQWGAIKGDKPKTNVQCTDGVL